jgi:hypothetical protein
LLLLLKKDFCNLKKEKEKDKRVVIIKGGRWMVTFAKEEISTI